MKDAERRLTYFPCSKLGVCRPCVGPGVHCFSPFSLPLFVVIVPEYTFALLQHKAFDDLSLQSTLCLSPSFFTVATGIALCLSLFRGCKRIVLMVVQDICDHSLPLHVALRLFCGEPDRNDIAMWKSTSPILDGEGLPKDRLLGPLTSDINVISQASSNWLEIVVEQLEVEQIVQCQYLSSERR